MKKLIWSAVFIALSTLMIPVTANAQKKIKGLKSKEMKTKIDSVSYAMGAAQSNGLKEYAVAMLGIDSAYFTEFVRGLKDGVTTTQTPKQKAYAAGQNIAVDVLEKMYPSVNANFFSTPDEMYTIDKALLVEGFIAAVAGNDLRIGGGMEGAVQYIDENAPLVQQAYMESRYGQNKAEGEEFLANNRLNDGVQVTASGLQYKVLVQGTGRIPAATDEVTVHYRGVLIDGTEFDSSYERGEPTSFQADRVIDGWSEALTMMPVGSTWLLYVPQELAYGNREMGTIPPYSTLIFEVELLEVEDSEDEFEIVEIDVMEDVG